MKYKNASMTLALTALFAHQSANAADAVYLGECERARAVQKQSTIDKLLPFARYEGVGRSNDLKEAKQQCRPEQITIDTLVQKSRSSSKLVFEVKTVTIFYGMEQDCLEPLFSYGERKGEMTLTTRMDEKNGICELYIWSSVTETVDYDPSWKGVFANRVLFMDGGNFTVASASATKDDYSTPIAYIGIK